MRIKRFIYRFKNQYRIHRKWASIWMIFRMAWGQSKKREKVDVEKIMEEIRKVKVQKLEDIKNKF